VQLDKLPQIIERKKSILARYHDRLDRLSQIRFIEVTPHSDYIPFRVAIYAERAMELMKFMELREIQSRTFFYPLHRQPAFQYLREDPETAEIMSNDHFPGANYAYENGICLPSFPSLTTEDLDCVCKTVMEFYRG
jgi:perosamine synthetase